MVSTEKACRECIEYRFKAYNNVWNLQKVPGEHFCKWCAKTKPELFWFDFENRLLAEQRQAYERARAKNWEPKKDTRAHYREPFLGEEE